MRRSVRTGIGLIGFLVLLACAGIDFPLSFLLFVAAGWAFFLYRVLPEVRVDAGGVALAAVCLVLFAAGAHWFLSWLYDQIQKAERPRGRWQPRWTVALVAGVVLMFVAGLATVGITHQVGWLLTSKEPWVGSRGGQYKAARRSQSVNNLKQVALALGSYAEANETLPPGGTFDAQGQPLHSWMTRLLPFIEQNDLYHELDLQVPWDDPRNRASFQKILNVYINPEILIENRGDRPVSYAPSHYSGNVHLLGGDKARAIRDIKDGTAQTLMAGEVPAGFKPWGDPTNWRDPAKGVNRVPGGFGGPYAGGANFSFADGSVRFIKNSINPRVLEALGTPAGGEVIAPDEY